MPPRSLLAALLLGLLALACQAPPAATPAGSAPPAVPAIAAAPAGPAPAVPAGQPLQKVVMGYLSPSESHIVPWLAQRTGIFARHGVDAEVHMVSGTPRLTQSLIAGDFDFVHVGAGGAMRARTEKADTVLLASSGDWANFRIMAHPQSGVRTIAGLRGRTVGVSQIGSESHTFLKLLLERERIPMDEVNILQAGSNPQAAQAMLTGNIDAAAVNGIMVSASERAGATLLADGNVLRIPTPRSSFASMRQRIDRDRDLTMRIMRAYVETVHFYKTQRDETIRLMQEFMSGLPLEDVAYLYEEGDLGYKPLPVLSEEAVQAVIDREFEGVEGHWKPSDFYDNTFLQEIERSGFLAQLWGR
jgi:NitT/TauT family transport system substrate-binding protein